MSAHTPGPWDVTTVDHSSGGSGAVPSTLFRVGFLSQKDFTGHVADKCHGDSYANAHLIAAAPELLEGLQYAIEQVPELATVPGIASAIDKALSPTPPDPSAASLPAAGGAFSNEVTP